MLKIKDIYLKTLKKVIKNCDYIEVADFPKTSQQVYKNALKRNFQKCFGMIGMYSANGLVNLITKKVITKYINPNGISERYRFEYDNSFVTRLNNDKASLWFIYATKSALRKIIFLTVNERETLRTDRGYSDSDIESLLMSDFSGKQYMPLIYVTNMKNDKLIIKIS